MVSPKQPTGSLPSTVNKRPSSSSDDVPPFSKHPEGDDNVDTLKKKNQWCHRRIQRSYTHLINQNLKLTKKLTTQLTKRLRPRLTKKIEAAADEKVNAAADGKGDAAVDGGVFIPTPVGKCFFVFTSLVPPLLSDLTEGARLLIVCGNDQHQGKWVALLDRKGSGHVQVNGKTISNYSFCFLNSGDEVVLSQAKNNPYVL
ncbi:hypothetical protein CQW23_30920 [Capsicum baccatum]|uniref:FHA domain-containing protein n=1 Tax=Capsicum baccatum TaxID=33114 RepID=A0A2G2V917_CAPBA|nr:hypothetical protein CQW23_30920 [Capsicum baccatum]